MKTMDEIKQELASHKNEYMVKYKVKELGIFGSYAKGEQKETSDLDVLVEFSAPVSLLHIVSLENYLSDILRIKVDVVPKKNVRYELREQIFNEEIKI